ncbi:pentatricopeptide repeat-containing protein At3g62470, mitochondrial-like [Andrographis paniculata]|uniref:pentatricopeptide repeat-containing protein At3g62470, mitochondrial-like n=1 Tax=Andrographis paniculata TaxID=175694 RepID=UPI0021E936BE|nr:pentatricopeptide repeat-containing protein At3g62470, mitochondrial-like [Andrographis paniculata]
MGFRLSNSRISLQLSTLLGGYDGGQFLDAAGLHSAIRGRRIQGKQVHGSSLPVRFLLNSFNYCSFGSSHCQIPFILPHTSSLYPVQKSLQVGEQQNFLLGLNLNCLPYSRNEYRLYCISKGVDSEPSDFEVGGERDNECSAVEVDLKEVERVSKVINETFSMDRNMEAVLDECGVNLSHELVLSVLDRFKHARKPAFRFFGWAANQVGFNHNSMTYNAMMNILGKARQFETMVSVLEEMGEKKLLTMETFIISIQAFAAAKERKKAVGVFDLMKKHNFKVGVETINCLLDALGKAKLAKEAQMLFEKLELSFTPNLKTYTVLLRGWCTVKNLLEAGKTWNEMVDNGFKPDIIAHNIMIEGLLRVNARSDAIKLFEMMKAKGPLPNVRSYTILIKYLCKHGNMTEAIDYFNDMLDSDCPADAALYTCLMTGFANQKRMDMVYWCLQEMEERSCPPDGRTYNALIKMLTSRHNPDDAVKIYKKMIRSNIQPSIHTYNMMLKSFFVTKKYEMGFMVWEEMKKRGCCPDENSYTVLIGGLMRQGRSDEACNYLDEMIEKGMKAPQIDFKKFEVNFSWAGRQHATSNLAQRMSFSRNSGSAKLLERLRRW